MSDAYDSRSVALAKLLISMPSYGFVQTGRKKYHPPGPAPLMSRRHALAILETVITSPDITPAERKEIKALIRKEKRHRLVT